MTHTVFRLLGLLALFASYRCFRWVASIWHWVDQNGHTEGSPAGLGIFAIGIGLDIVLVIAGGVLAVLGLLGLILPGRFSSSRDRSDE